MEPQSQGSSLLGRSEAVAPGAVPPLSGREFDLIRELVKRHAGISLGEQKRELVQARLGKLLRERGLASFRDYYRLVTADGSGAELTRLLDAISTNQTAFWREPAHFEFLLRELLPAWHREGRSRRGLRFWSAGCSTGEEPYTLAMVLWEALPEAEARQSTILASDLNTQVLASARRGIYPGERLTPLPPEWRRRYFLRGVGRWEGYVQVKPQLKEMVHFFRHNLTGPLPFTDGVEVIFCRNVMIYFEKETQAEVIGKFYQGLTPGGYLFIGHSESLCNLSHRFAYIRPTIYRK
ncbi:MAG: protein-glutamate O-methyltransferase CheR [Syntrophobacterales bacterium]|nr:protein-glutamate O-methyltransferase CheR [Syntrophobacterales bacterium]